MKTPLENIVEWFNALPVSYRQAVAVEVASMMPGMEPNISNPFYHKQFIAKISDPSPTGERRGACRFPESPDRRHNHRPDQRKRKLGTDGKRTERSRLNLPAAVPLPNTLIRSRFNTSNGQPYARAGKRWRHNPLLIRRFASGARPFRQHKQLFQKLYRFSYETKTNGKKALLFFQESNASFFYNFENDNYSHLMSLHL